MALSKIIVFPEAQQRNCRVMDIMDEVVEENKKLQVIHDLMFRYGGDSTERGEGLRGQGKPREPEGCQ